MIELKNTIEKIVQTYRKSYPVIEQGYLKKSLRETPYSWGWFPCYNEDKSLVYVFIKYNSQLVLIGLIQVRGDK